jgi:ABC-type Fe3+-citrate transport system substrate-binding protein
MRRLPLVLLLVLAALALTAAGCGSSDESSSSTTTAEEGEESATPEEAVAQIAAIKVALAKAVTQVEVGNRELADETVGDAYLEHYEEVEGPLGDRDHDLMEEIEEAISTDLRNRIKDGDDPSQIQASVDEINGKLDEAVGKLQS